MNCDHIKDSVVQYLQTETEVIPKCDYCILSLPIKVLDGANAEVYIEEVGNDSFLVHDGGRTIGHLQSSGLIVSKSRTSSLSALAERLGITLDEGVFKALAKQVTIQDVAFSVGQCCSMALYELIKHAPFADEERMRNIARQEMETWSAERGIRLVKNKKVPGSLRQYTLDFVVEAIPGSTDLPVAVNILIPSYGASVAVDRYATQVLDLRNTEYNKWKRVAVLAKPERWKERQRKIVGKLADAVAEISDSASSNQLLWPSHSIGHALDSLPPAA